MILFPDLKKTKRKRARKKVEEPHQVMFVEWFRMQYPHLSPFLNIVSIGENVGALRMNRLKEMGYTPGWPDLFLALPKCKREEVIAHAGARPKVYYVDVWTHGLFIELKQPKITGKSTPRASSSQKNMIEFLKQRGYEAKLCFGWEEAKIAVQEYFNEGA